MIVIEGSHGGGQLLRTALSLSAATEKEFEINNIRGQREEQGLKPQHLTAVHAMQKLCRAEVTGASLGSTKLVFRPHEVESGNYRFDIGTAGSTTLLLQTLIPACLHGEKESVIEVIGGTDTKWCPPSLYFTHVFGDFLKKMGIHAECKIERFGFYPKGGGKIMCRVKPCKELKDVHFTERGKRKGIHVAAYASADLQTREVAERLVKGFQGSFSFPVEIDKQYVPALSSGCFVHARTEHERYFIGADVLGEIGKRAEDVGEECAEKMVQLLQQDGVDRYAADQLLIYMALKGKGEIRVVDISDHVRANIAVIEQFLPVKFEVKNNVITCKKI